MLLSSLAYRVRFVSAIAVALLLVGTSSTEAQLSKLRPRSYSSNTMNFANVTATNLVQTVTEIPDNEKEVEVGDVDRDGDLDVVIVCARSFSFSGRRRNKLYLNNNGVLQESSQLVTGSGSWDGFNDFDVARNAFLRDFDADGWLDLIVISDDFAGLAVGTTRYYANQHPGGVFTGFADQTGRLNGSNGAACGGACGDFDSDGDHDYWFGNYPGPSQDTMEFNNGAGSFSRASSNLVPSDSDYTVDVATGDINGDGKLDLFVSNDNDPSFIYYNDANGAGSGVGDFRYSGSTQQLHPGTNFYPAMEAGDFNRDGKLDLYFANFGTGGNAGKDSVLVNTGNDASGKVMFDEYVMPSFVSNNETAKVTVSDLNGDGRLDIIVMGGSQHFSSQNRRPVIYRNTSVNGQTSFVEWTPAPAFPSGSIHAGWHSAAFDVDGDKKKDILVGAMNNDFLFKSVATPSSKDSNLGGSLPSIHNSDPHAIVGSITSGSPDNFTGSLPAGATVSAVLNSTAGVTLEVRNSSGSVIASSNRGGRGVEEAVQFTSPGGNLEFRVVLDQPTGTLGTDSYQLEVLSRSN